MIQIDMAMPESCAECRFSQGGYMYCHAMPEDFCGYVNYCEEDGKPEWCPLKAQEPVEPETKEVIYDYEHRSVYCPGCDNRLAGLTNSGAVALETEEIPNYCWMCGQAVKW